MTKAEKQEYLELNRERILELIASGALPAEKNGDSIKVKRSDLERAIASGALPAPRLPN
jgi:excisionase family DNA binding protein